MTQKLTREALDLHTQQTASPSFKLRRVSNYASEVYPAPVATSPAEALNSPLQSRKSIVASMRDKQGQPVQQPAPKRKVYKAERKLIFDEIGPDDSVTFLGPFLTSAAVPESKPPVASKTTVPAKRKAPLQEKTNLPDKLIKKATVKTKVSKVKVKAEPQAKAKFPQPVAVKDEPPISIKEPVKQPVKGGIFNYGKRSKQEPMTFNEPEFLKIERGQQQQHVQPIVEHQEGDFLAEEGKEPSGSVSGHTPVMPAILIEQPSFSISSGLKQMTSENRNSASSIYQFYRVVPKGDDVPCTRSCCREDSNQDRRAVEDAPCQLPCCCNYYDNGYDETFWRQNEYYCDGDDDDGYNQLQRQPRQERQRESQEYYIAPPSRPAPSECSADDDENYDDGENLTIRASDMVKLEASHSLSQHEIILKKSQLWQPKCIRF